MLARLVVIAALISNEPNLISGITYLGSPFKQRGEKSIRAMLANELDSPAAIRHTSSPA